jgi:predicted AAA+ superfamily ATPase
MASSWPGDAQLLIFDEIHKYRQWKSLIKGEYDKLKDTYKFLVTGSARLDLYRRGGDSLQGRYHYYRLHPFTLAEIEGISNKVSIRDKLPAGKAYYQETLDRLDEFGGFPEPFTKRSKRQLRRWHNEKVDRMFREDILDVQAIRDIGNMKLLSDILPSKVGSLLSLNQTGPWSKLSCCCPLDGHSGGLLLSFPDIPLLCKENTVPQKRA